MKKLMKILCLVLVLVMVVAPVASFANSFKEFASADGDIGGLKDDIGTLGQGVYGILRTIGLIVAVCMIAYMGIQWLLATPAKKAELKGRMWSMAIGVVLLVGGVAFLGILENAVKETDVIANHL